MPRAANFIQRYCSVEGCNGKHYARTWCRRHYGQWFMTGDPIPLWTKKAKPGEAFSWLREHSSYAQDTCLIWPFARDRIGYGILYHERTRKAHRLMCMIAHGEPLSHSLQAAHICGNGSNGCVNPRHIKWATPVENEADKIVHGTTNRGERSVWAKLEESDIHLIRDLASSTSRVQIANMFGVGRQEIDRIISGERWAWLHQTSRSSSVVEKPLSKSRISQHMWWKRAVLKRDRFTCQKCGISRQNNMHAHHLRPYALHSDSRLDVDNGVTLCPKCHLDYHRNYGVARTNPQTFAEYLNAFQRRVA